MLDPPLIPTEFVIKYIREMMINFVKKKNLSVALAQAAWGQNPSHPRRNPPHPPPRHLTATGKVVAGKATPTKLLLCMGDEVACVGYGDRRPEWFGAADPSRWRLDLASPQPDQERTTPDGGGPVEVRGHARKGVHDEKAPCEESMVMDGTTRRAEMDGVGDGCTTRPAARRGQRRRQHGGHRDLRS